MRPTDSHGRQPHRPRLERLEARDVPAATLQVIHNSPYAAAAIVDVYVNDALTLDNVAFRTASKFLDVPSAVPLEIDITAGDAPDNKTPVFTQTVTLADGKNYVAIATGDPAQTTGLTKFQLLTSDIARTTAGDASKFEFLPVHGSPDAPTVDIAARGVATLVNDVSYPTVGGSYVPVAPGQYVLDVQTADGKTTVASFNLAAAANTAAVVLASGFLSPPSASDPAFGLLAVFPDGTSGLLTVAGTAKLQVIHNSPYAAAAVVDVYVNDVLTLDNVAFRTASKFLEVPSGVPLDIDVTAGTATDNKTPVFSQTLTLDANKNYLAIATGDPSKTTGTTKFQLLTTDIARLTAANAKNFEFLAVHGSPDAPTVDLAARGVGTLVDNINFTSIDSEYISVPAGRYVADVLTADGKTVVASFNATGVAGVPAIVLASGFLTPPTATDPAFGLLAVFPDGKSALLSALVETPTEEFAAGGVVGSDAKATLYGPDGKAIRTVTAFTGATGTDAAAGARVATGDVNGDGTPDLVVGAGVGLEPRVKVYDGKTGTVIADFLAFESTYTGGLFLASADFNSDGKSDVVVTPDRTGGARVSVYDGAILASSSGKTATPIANFLAFSDDTTFRGGARAGVGDLNGDGLPELVVSAGFSGGPRIAVYEGKAIGVNAAVEPQKLFADFFAFEANLRNGAFVSVGDLNDDGFGDLVFGAGPGGAPRVRSISSKDILPGVGSPGKLASIDSLAPLVNFFVGTGGGRDGVRVAVKDLDGDDTLDLVVNSAPDVSIAPPGSPTGGLVRTYRNPTAAAGNPPESSAFSPFDVAGALGVYVG